MKSKSRLPMNLQFFAEPAGGTGDGGAGAQQNPPNNQPASGGSNASVAIDYEKLAGIIQGKQTVAEDTILKNYFKQQNLSQEEAAQAIAAYKAQKAKNQPDVGELQNQVTQHQAAALQAQVRSEAIMAAVELGIEAKTIPYVLKMADMSQVVGQDGAINKETLKNAINQVLEDVPALKPQAAASTGFVQLGSNVSGQQTNASDDDLKKAFGL